MLLIRSPRPRSVPHHPRCSVAQPGFEVPAPKTEWQRRVVAGSMAKMTRRFRPETGKFEMMVENRKVVGKATASRAFGIATLLSCGTFAAGVSPPPHPSPSSPRHAAVRRSHPPDILVWLGSSYSCTDSP